MPEQPKQADPILGESYEGHVCNYTAEGGICGKPATAHIIWEGRLHSSTCEEHIVVANQKRYEQIHSMSEWCTDARAMWFPEESTCKIPKNEAEIAIGIFLMNA